MIELARSTYVLFPFYEAETPPSEIVVVAPLDIGTHLRAGPT